MDNQGGQCDVTHPIKELEIVLNGGVFLLDAGKKAEAADCLREAAEILNGYFGALGFDESGRPPRELAAAERIIMSR